MTITKTNIVNQALIALGELVISDVDSDTSKRATTMKELYDIKLNYLLRKFNWKFAIKRIQLDVLEYYLDFDGMSAAPVVGEVVSGATGEGTVAAFIYTSATAGRLYLQDVTIGFVDNEALSGDGSFSANANGVETAATPLNDFSYKFALPSDYIRLIELNPNYISYRIEQNLILCDESSTLDIRYVYDVFDPNTMDAAFIEAFAALLAKESAVQITDSLRKYDVMNSLYEDKISEARFLGSIEDDLDSIQPDDRESWLVERY